MKLFEQLRAQAEEFRIYASAECLPARAAQWEQWANTCEAAARELEPVSINNPEPIIHCAGGGDLSGCVT